MPCTAYKWKKSQPLTEDYIQEYDRVSSLFDYNPWGKESLHERADAVRHSDALRADRSVLAEVLIEYNRRMGGKEAAIAAAGRLADEHTLAVVGGQQAGLFGGPLYVIYKAVTLIMAARQAEAELGTPVIPVFWIAGEDHDFEEVDHIHVLRPGLDISKIAIDRPWNLRTSVSRWEAEPEAWEAALRQLDEALPDSPHKAGLLRDLRTAITGDRTLSGAFAGWMAALFGDSGLVLLDADDPALRRLEGPMFAQLIGGSASLAAALVRGREQVESLGYAPQVDVSDEQAHLFVHDRGERVLLQRSGDGFTDKKGLRTFSREELLKVAAEEPERLSNGVMSRPLMQEFLLPVLGTVLGPAEVAYWAMTRDAFHLNGMTMPIVLPRLEFTIVEDTVTKWMDKYELSMDDAASGSLAARKEAWLGSQSPFPVEQRFEEARAGVREIYSPLLDSLASIEAGLPELGRSNLDKILHQIDYLQHKSEQALVRKHETALAQWKRVEQSLTPLGKPQERVYNVCAFLSRYGYNWLDELVEADLAPDGSHYLIHI
ncbi:bacillithiol biosynthesis cysteine-adding enzyme BshC [Paenibacillus lutrae]|uniref:Putative cysteine ligase BshC n=1 Tax=Paenibacillus lutrae TaxID=2078573 RepID=A0A7X3JYW6_9BACL|nr:bacillithiol biosynthesis cysteine-adding enzyme BshC [Paenibacillus lutrae]MVO99379.1 bacillithiol biosynthesis cysteine-adding enzyme BshC [Paenibacillus lutrae]